MQPVTGSQYKVVSGTAAGTTTISRDCVLDRVVIPANKTGTVTFKDSAGTIAVVPCTVGTIPTAVEFGCAVRNNLVMVSGGTTDMTVMYH